MKNEWIVVVGVVGAGIINNMMNDGDWWIGGSVTLVEDGWMDGWMDGWILSD